MLCGDLIGGFRAQGDAQLKQRLVACCLSQPYTTFKWFPSFAGHLVSWLCHTLFFAEPADGPESRTKARLCRQLCNMRIDPFYIILLMHTVIGTIHAPLKHMLMHLSAAHLHHGLQSMNTHEYSAGWTARQCKGTRHPIFHSFPTIVISHRKCGRVHPKCSVTRG